MGVIRPHVAVSLIPRGYKYTTHMPDGKSGLSWQSIYGVVGIDAVGKDIIVEGMNEKGLTVGLFYHPGFAEYQDYDPAQAAQSLGPTDVGQYLLTNYATVDEVRSALACRSLSLRSALRLPSTSSLPNQAGRPLSSSISRVK